MKKLLKRLEERREVIENRHNAAIDASIHYEELNDEEETEWWRTQAMRLSARLYEIDMIIDWVKGEIKDE